MFCKGLGWYCRSAMARTVVEVTSRRAQILSNLSGSRMPGEVPRNGMDR